MPRKGENIYKRKDGRWEARYIKGYNINGKAVYGYVYEHSYTKVKNKLREVVCQQMVSPVLDSATTFDMLFDRWLLKKRNTVKESTYAQYERIIEKRLRMTWGKIKVSEFSETQFNMYLDQLLESGRLDGKGGLSDKAANDIAVVFKNVILFAQRQGVNLSGSFGKNCRVKCRKKQLKVISKEDQRELVHFLTNDINLEKLAILICLFCGLRIGEICALQWQDINTSKRILSVRRTLQRIKSNSTNGGPKTKIVITPPKSECSIRDIPIPGFLVSYIEKFSTNPEAFVLTGDKFRYVEPRTMQYRFQRMLMECQITHVNFHSLRHTFATRCIELDFEIKSLSEILGHSTVSITLNRYVHPSFDVKMQNMEKLAVLSQ